MLLLIFWFLCVLILGVFVFLVSWRLSLKIVEDSEKRSPFECGFDPKGSARIPFSMRFFLLAVVFLIFDVEIRLILPLPLSFDLGLISSSAISGAAFFLILILGLFHEWKEGSLDWV